MATAKQIAANRRNSQKSTGPKSVETKAIVAQNGIQHGLCAKFHVLDEVEKQENFDIFLNRLMEDEQPVGQAEIELVVKMAEHTWLSKRALRMQTDCFASEPKTPEQKKNGDIPVRIDDQLERFVRYQTAHDRAYQRASTDLQKRKKARQLAEIGFASQKRAEAEAIRKAEKHAVQMDIAKIRKQRDNIRKQREEMKLGDEITKMLPVAHSASGARCARSDWGFDIAELNSFLAAAAPAGIKGD